MRKSGTDSTPRVTCPDGRWAVPAQTQFVDYASQYIHMTPSCHLQQGDVSVEAILNAMRWPSNCDDDEIIKAILVMNLVECTLMIMAQNPRERARFFPCEYAHLVYGHLQNKYWLGQAGPAEVQLLSALQTNPNLITDDTLFNTARVCHHIPLRSFMGTNETFYYDVNALFGLSGTHYPYLCLVTRYYDIDTYPNYLVQKAYAIANKLGIDTENIFRESLKIDLPYNRKYALSLMDRFFDNFTDRVVIVGEQYGVKQSLAVVRMESGLQYLPLSFISSTECSCPKPVYLPASSVHLYGQEKLLYENAQVIMLTPNLSTAIDNTQVMAGAAVLSWWGRGNTIDLVDWHPLTGRTVYYILRRDDFGGDLDKAVACMNAVREKLLARECSFHIIDEEKTIYSPQEVFAFYRKYEQRPPAGLVDYDAMIVDLKDSQSSTPGPVFSRFVNRKQIVMLFGPPNIGKSPLADSMMYALARGYNLNDRHTISTPMTVLMVCGEMSDSELMKRKAWYEKMFPVANEETFFEIVRCSGNLADTQGQKGLEEQIAHVNAKHPGKQKVKVVILDSVKTLTRNGDSQSGWNGLFEYLDRTRVERDRTWILIHHTNKEERQSFGTFDIDIKLDVKVSLSEDITNLKEEIAGSGVSPKMWSDYTAHVAHMYRKKFSGDRTDAIRFYFTITKGRALKKSDFRPILLSFVPEDENPRWEVEDISSPESPWSFDAWQKQAGGATEPQNPSRSQKGGCEASTLPMPNSQSYGEGELIPQAHGDLPTYEELKAMPKDEVVRHLRAAVEAGCPSRSKIGCHFRCSMADSKNGIDYLMDKHDLRNEDIGLSGRKGQHP